MRPILLMFSGVAVWALHFTATYGLTALACARGWNRLVVPSIAASTAIAVAAMVFLLFLGWRSRARFESWMTAGIAALALVGIAWQAIPVLMVPVCG